MRRPTTFDLLGGLSLLAFVAVVAFDVAELRWRDTEISLAVGPEALAEGFREGVEWQGIYDDEGKVGWARLERRRRVDGYELSSHTSLRTRGPGEARASEIEITSELGLGFELRGFRADVENELVQLHAQGRVEPGRIVIDVTGGPFGDGGSSAPRRLELAAQRPSFDVSLRPLVMREDLEPGRRFAFEHLDPMTLTMQRTTLEYLGRDAVVVMGERVDAHWLRQEVAGQVLEVWVNDLGEVLREQLPGGLTAVRESEAEATWGIEREDGGQPR